MIYRPHIFLLSIILVSLAAYPIFSQDDEAKRAKHHYKLGRKHYKAGQTSAAIDDLYTALSIQELFPKAQILLGHSLMNTGRYPEAIAVLKGIDKPHRDTAETQKLLGKTYYEMNNLRAARDRFNYAIFLSKRPDYELHYLLSLVEHRDGNSESAIREAKTAVSLKPKFAASLKALSDAYAMIGDYVQAEKMLVRHIDKVRNQIDITALQTRLNGIKNLAGAKPEESVQSIIRPKVRHMPKPVYTDEARRYRVEGMVRVQVLFGKDGTIDRAFIAKSLGYGLDEEALKAVKAIEFAPGQVNGQPYSMWMGVQIRFGVISIEIDGKAIEGARII